MGECAKSGGLRVMMASTAEITAAAIRMLSSKSAPKGIGVDQRLLIDGEDLKRHHEASHAGASGRGTNGFSADVKACRQRQSRGSAGKLTQRCGTKNVVGILE